MCAPSPPIAPDYVGAAKEQGAANEATARLQSRTNNPNVVTPFGSQNVSWGASPTFDETAYKSALDAWKQSNQIPQYDENGAVTSYTLGNNPMPDVSKFFTQANDQPTITQTYSPEYQGLLDTNRQLQERMGMLGLGAADIASGTLNQGVSFDSAPQVGSASDTRQRVYDAMMGRVNEDYGKSRDQANSDLVAAGIGSGSKAYGDRMQMLERSRNDARSQAELAAGSEAQREFGQNMDSRRQAITEILAKRQTPLNEISAFRSGSQISPLTFPGVQPTNVAPPPMFGATQAQGQSDMGIYNQQAASANSTQSGLMSIAAMAALYF